MKYNFLVSKYFSKKRTFGANIMMRTWTFCAPHENQNKLTTPHDDSSVTLCPFL